MELWVPSLFGNEKIDRGQLTAAYLALAGVMKKNDF
jgi:hypothetical protein